jgi:hypothetical protein
MLGIYERDVYIHFTSLRTSSNHEFQCATISSIPPQLVSTCQATSTSPHAIITARRYILAAPQVRNLTLAVSQVAILSRLLQRCTENRYCW